MHKTMKRLKIIDIESYNNSKVKIYIGSYLFSFFVIAHLILFKLYRFKAIFEHGSFNYILFWLMLSEAILMGFIVHMVISTAYKDETDESTQRSSEKDQQSLFVNQHVMFTEKSNKRLNTIDEHMEFAEETKEESEILLDQSKNNFYFNSREDSYSEASEVFSLGQQIFSSK